MSSSATSESIKILTSKTWVLPPRPKPGRKPSLDTPTTKRKAQNRAAQRAFRERKANKIQELEQSMSELKSERNRIEISLTNVNNDYSILNKNFNNIVLEKKSLLVKVAQLTEQLKIKQCPSCKNRLINNPNGVSPYADQTDSSDIISNLSAKITYLEKSLEDKNILIKQLQQRRPSLGYNNSGSPGFSPFTNTPSPFAYSGNSNSSANFTSGSAANSVSSLPTPSSQHASPFPSTADDGNCGACDKDDCICETIGIKSSANKAASIIEEHNRTEKQRQNNVIQGFKPLEAVPLKRKHEQSEKEIDFTYQFGNSSNSLLDKRSAKQQKLNKFFQKTKESKRVDKIETTYSESYEVIPEATVSKSLSDIFSNNDLFKSFVSKDHIEPCGFCSDNSPCVCREALREAKNSITAASGEPHKEDSKLPPILSANNNNAEISKKEKLHVLHPGPTVELNQYKSSPSLTSNGFLPQGPELTVPNYSSESKDGWSLINSNNKDLSAKESQKTGCTGNPGTCLQCQSDPMSTLFCTTIASKVSDERSKPITTQPKIHRSSSTSLLTALAIFKSSTSSESSSSSLTGSSNVSSESLILSLSTTVTGVGNEKQLFIPCSDAYKTLSRHEQFKKMDFNSLVGKLTTRGMQVEVQSVVNVLRELDRRLYN